MILIDCLYINNGGGKVLLDELVSEVNQSKLNVQFLFDRRILNYYDSNLFVNKPIYTKANITTRLLYYLRNRKKFTLVFTFGNIPPPLKLSISTYTYLHNILYLQDKNSNGLKNKSILFFKTLYIYFLRDNTKYWIVQTNVVKLLLANKWKISKDKILVIPFFKEISNLNTKELLNSEKKLFEILYVSNGETYKNHLNLFQAFELLYKNKKNVILKVTLAEQYKNLLDHLNIMIQKNIPIINLGILDNEKIHIEYLNKPLIIFPSLYESFGLGLIEAAQHNLSIIASNRDYVHEIIIPSYVFEPLSVDSILNALEYAYNNHLNPSSLIIKNEIKKIINILNYGNEK